MVEFPQEPVEANSFPAPVPGPGESVVDHHGDGKIAEGVDKSVQHLAGGLGQEKAPPVVAKSLKDYSISEIAEKHSVSKISVVFYKALDTFAEAVFGIKTNLLKKYLDREDDKKIKPQDKAIALAKSKSFVEGKKISEEDKASFLKTFDDVVLFKGHDFYNTWMEALNKLDLAKREEIRDLVYQHFPSDSGVSTVPEYFCNDLNVGPYKFPKG